MLEAGGSFAGVNRKVQLKPTKWSEPEEGSTEPPHLVEALLILKHGGVLTHAGRQQACAAISSMLSMLLQLYLCRRHKCKLRRCLRHQSSFPDCGLVARALDSAHITAGFAETNARIGYSAETLEDMVVADILSCRRSCSGVLCCRLRRSGMCSAQ